MLKNLSFKSKLFGLSLLLMGITLILFSAITFHYGSIASKETIDEKLTNAQSIQKEFINKQAKQLELISLLISYEPAFVSYIAQSINYYKENKQTQFLTSIADLLQERKQQYGFDFAIITDTTGIQMARSNQIITTIKSLSNNLLLKQAIQQLQPVSGYWYEKQQLYQASIVPIAQGQNLVGFLITGNEINNIYLNKLTQLSGTEVMVVNENNNKFKILASSSDVGLTTAFENIINISKRFVKMKQGVYSDIKINRNTYVISSNDLVVNNQSNINLLTAVSRDKILAPFIQTRISLLIAGVLLAIISWFLTILIHKPFFFELKKLAFMVKAMKKNTHLKHTPFKSIEFYEISNNIIQLDDHIKGKNSLAKHLVEVSKKIPLVNDYFWVASDKETIKPNHTIGGRFKILRKIGSGGMGMVFQAIDTELNELIALKVLKKTTNESLQISQLKDEIKFSRRIANPNVVRIHDFGKIGGHVFISMEFIMGFTIAEVLSFSGKLRPLAAKYTAIEVCKGLQAAHNEGIIHRDLKPENLIIELDNTVKLMDFGIASTQNHVSKSRQSELIEGTINYSSPEQLQATGADERSDIYALGTLIMEIFCGKRPFSADDEEELMIKKVSEKPTLISEYWAAAPKKLEKIISKCLRLDPKQRYQSVTDVLLDLKAVSFIND